MIDRTLKRLFKEDFSTYFNCPKDNPPKLTSKGYDEVKDALRREFKQVDNRLKQIAEDRNSLEAFDNCLVALVLYVFKEFDWREKLKAED